MVFRNINIYGLNSVKAGFRWYDCTFILICTYLLILQIDAIWPFTIDDMYISLRYAKNWANGNGLLWNINSPPVEGYTNFSFVALAALAQSINFDPVLVLKGMGLIGLLVTCLFMYLISRTWFTKRVSLIPCIYLLLYKGQIIWAVSGLETTVYQALISGAIYFIFRGLGYKSTPYARGKSQYNYFVYAGLMMSFSGMTRPEAPALMILFFLLMCWDRPKTSIKEHWVGLAIFSTTIVLVYLPYFFWHWFYYGFLVPNSVFCKGFVNIYFSLDASYLRLAWPFMVLSLPAIICASDKRHYFLWMPSLAYLAMLINSDPIVAFDNRLFLPAFILLLPLSLQGITKAIQYFIPKNEALYKYFLYSLSICSAIVFIPSMTLPEYRYFTVNPKAGDELRKEVVSWLRTNAKAGDSVVLADTGMIPYYSDLIFIDSYCLNNLSMAHYPIASRYEQFCYKILADKPQVIILTSLIEDGKTIYPPGDLCLKKILNNQNRYRASQIFSTKNSESIYQYELFTYF